MSEPAPDELAGGSARDPVRAPGWLRAAALVAIAGLACWVLVERNGPSVPVAGSGQPPTPAFEHSEPGLLGAVPAQRAVVLGSQPGLLGVRAVCLRAGPGHALSLGVDLVNGRLARTTLLSVTRVAATGEASVGGVTLPARRSCDGQLASEHSLVMRPGGVVPLRIGLRRTDLCGGLPLPVQVDVSILGPGETPATQRLTLHPEAAGPDAPACPSP